MFIHAFEGSWLDHTFWRKRFLVDDDATLVRVQNCGARECWIDTERGVDVATPQQGAVTQAPPAPPPRKPPPVALADELRNAAQVIERSRTVVTNLHREARMGRSLDVSQCAGLVTDVVESVDRNAEAMVSLARLKMADEYTYMHSVAVCALMIAVGRQFDLDDAECREAGMAGLLHDMGKALMPQEILNKPGKLTDEEFAIIKTHPERGHELLVQSGGHSQGVLEVCLHHHERMDGKGYPHGLAGDAIPLIARMGAVCDVYDAVTSNRPYKAGWDPAEAIAQMVKWKGHFDVEVLRALIKSVGIFPTGSLVRLASGRLAVVVEQNAGKPTAPLVKVFFSTKSNLALRPELLDLARSGAADSIVDREAPEKWRFGYLNELWAADAAIARALDLEASKNT
jgi:HD-GYP domain-containing protein (c-di-GMP phosphodiesterase class II)